MASKEIRVRRARSLRLGALAASGCAAVVLASTITAAAVAATESPNWGPPTDLHGENAYSVKLARGTDGTMAAVWLSGTGIDADNDTQIHVAVKPADASRFGPSVAVSSVGEEVNRPRAAVGPQGEVTVVWERYEANRPAKIEYRTKGPGESSFGAGGVIDECGEQDGETRHCIAPMVAYGPNGEATVTWSEDNYTSSTIEVRAATRQAGADDWLFEQGSGEFDQITQCAASSTAPADIAYQPDGTLILLLEEIYGIGVNDQGECDISSVRGDGVGATIQQVTRAADDQKFGLPEDLSLDSDREWSSLTVSSAGEVAAVWTLHREEVTSNKPLVVQMATRPVDAADFNAPVDLGLGHSPAASYGPDGRLSVAYVSGVQFSQTDSVVKVRTRAGSGAGFGAAAQVSRPGGQIPWIHMATAPDGTTTVAWQRTTNLGTSQATTVQSVTRPASSNTFSTPQNKAPAGHVSYCAYELSGYWEPDYFCGPFVEFNEDNTPIVVWATQPNTLFFVPGTVPTYPTGKVQFVTTAETPPVTTPTDPPVTPPTSPQVPPTADRPATPPEGGQTATPAQPPNVQERARLKVKAFKKRKKLRVGKRTMLVRGVQTNADTVKFDVQCDRSGKQLKGKAKKRLCGIHKNKKLLRKSQVRVRPTCSADLSYTLRVQVTGNGLSQNSWKRTWSVKKKPRVACALRKKK